MKFKISLRRVWWNLKKFEVNLSDFKKIPYVGEATEADLLALGYKDIASLKGADPEEMFERTKALGRGSDRLSSMFTAWSATMQIRHVQTRPS